MGCNNNAIKHLVSDNGLSMLQCLRCLVLSTSIFILFARCHSQKIDDFLKIYIKSAVNKEIKNLYF